MKCYLPLDLYPSRTYVGNFGTLVMGVTEIMIISLHKKNIKSVSKTMK